MSLLDVVPDGPVSQALDDVATGSFSLAVFVLVALFAFLLLKHPTTEAE